MSPGVNDKDPTFEFPTHGYMLYLCPFLDHFLVRKHECFMLILFMSIILRIDKTKLYLTVRNFFFNLFEDARVFFLKNAKFVWYMVCALILHCYFTLKEFFIFLFIF